MTKYEDKVRLLAALDNYALATEFPIYGRCSIPELAGELRIPGETFVPRTRFEELGIPSIDTIEILFSGIDQRLSGSIRASFLVDTQGKPVFRTPQAEWVEVGVAGDHDYERKRSNLIFGSSYQDVYSGRFRDAVCVDGILVAGVGGRSRDPRFEGMIGGPGNPMSCGELVSFLLDIRGTIKPPLTPARTPLERLRGWEDESPRWAKMQQVVHKAEGLLLLALLAKFDGEVDLETFWALTFIYGGKNSAVYWMPAGSLWSAIGVPIGYEGGNYEWKRLTSLPPLEIISQLSAEVDGRRSVAVQRSKNQRGQIHLKQLDGGVVGECSRLSGWVQDRTDCMWSFTLLTALMSTVVLSGQRPRLELRSPEDPDSAPAEYIVGLHFDWFILLPYSGDLHDFVSVHLPLRNANRSHPIVKVLLESRWLEQKSGLQEFAKALVSILSQGSGFDSNQYWQKKIGHLYRSVNWVSVAAEFHPPYKVFTSEGEVILVTNEVLESWADRPIAAAE
ncbi:MAG TPA: hypothetical protein VF179_25730 [Thermoanaerobaculia bacterium]|nr:hypothetical protein [Thermoanaerobaculia bacterium]